MKKGFLTKVVAGTLVAGVFASVVGISVFTADAAGTKTTVKPVVVSVNPPEVTASGTYLPDQMDVAVLVDAVQTKYERVYRKKLSVDNRLKLFRAYRTQYANVVLAGDIISTTGSGDTLTVKFKPENPAIKAKALSVNISKSFNMQVGTDITDYTRIILHVKWNEKALENRTYGFSIVASALR